MRRIDALSLEYPFYGGRQMARHLRREGVSVGRRRVRRLMRVTGLEAIYRRPRTSDAQLLTFDASARTHRRHADDADSRSIDDRLHLCRDR